ncbi:hypothetical protein ABE179_07205 [Aliarcobacter skirrowii]|uniref:hypothetical protein n=1 Tax=Aliarcobacter skirrowii TaxID=28200 RepID=UPI003207C746
MRTIKLQIVVDLSFLEDEIQKGFDSGISPKTHEEIMDNLKQKYKDETDHLNYSKKIKIS